MVQLTRIQRRVFDFVRSNIVSGRGAPTTREIAEKFGWASKRAAVNHVEAIIRKGWLVAEPGRARALRLTRPLPEVVEIPLLGVIPAGYGSEETQAEGECVPVAVESIGFKPTRNTFALRVAGDSMEGRHICDGDIAVCEHGPEPRNGQIVAALIDRKNTLKTFVVKRGKPFLKAENPKYPDLIPSEELVIQGVVKAVIRRLQE